MTSAQRLIGLSAISHRDLSKATGINTSRLDQLERGSAATVIELCVLCDAVGVTRVDMDDDIADAIIIKQGVEAHSPNTVMNALMSSHLRLAQHLDHLGV